MITGKLKPLQPKTIKTYEQGHTRGGAGIGVSDVSASALMVVFISAATLKTGIIREGTAADTFIHMEVSASQPRTNMHV